MLSSTALYTLLAIPLIPVVYFLFGLSRWFAHKRKIRAAAEQIPGPKRDKFFGNILQIPRKGEDILDKWLHVNCVKFKTAFSVQFGPIGTGVQLCHPCNVKKLLKTSEPKHTSDGAGYSLLLEWLGYGLLINSGSGWLRNRRLLTPAFHFDVLKPYIKVYNEAANIFREKCLKLIDPSVNPDGVIEVFQPVGLCALNVMFRCAFSYNEEIQTQGDSNPYVKTVGELSRLIFKRFFNPILYWNPLYYATPNGKKWRKGCKYAHTVAYDIIKKRQTELSDGATAETIKSKRAVDFLDILLLAKDENGKGLTDLEIRSEVDTFLFEGHDTTASAISWTLYMLAAHPEYQSKASAEVDSLLEGRESDDIEWDDLNKLPYLTMCIKESMRHTPPVPIFFRELTNPLEIDGVTLIPGTVVTVSAYNIHHNPLVWGEDHGDYKPDRFLHENIKTMDSHAFIPFSAGPRNCIGQNFAMNEIKTVLAKVLHKFVLDVDPTKIPQRNPMLIMRPVKGIHLNFQPR